MKVLIIDGYIDEPSCLGVSPYISYYPRYIAGALIESKFSEEEIFYTTIDYLRKNEYNNLIDKFDIVIIIAGITVPGKYFDSIPITMDEIIDIFEVSNGIKIIGGPIVFGYSPEGGKKAVPIDNFLNDNIIICKKDIESFIYDNIINDKKILQNNIKNIDTYYHRFRYNEEIKRWSIKGSFITKKHPKYPNVICEIETYRGCTRKKKCSFCTEVFYNSVCSFRNVEDIVLEIRELYQKGIFHIRIGGQSDLFAYYGIDNCNEILKPNPKIIEQLYRKIRIVAPELKTLHMDNVNPLTISLYPDESIEIIKSIIKYHTPGDVIALGIESLDPNVIKKNNLKVTYEDAFDVIKLINSLGSKKGNNGIPEILPGLNFIYGLYGETKKTFDINYNFLLDVYNSNLLLRRINIRKLISFDKTNISNQKLNSRYKYSKLFKYHKEKIRKSIDLPLLRKMFPIGTVLKNLFLDNNQNYIENKNIKFCRQFGTYPILVGVLNGSKYKNKPSMFTDIVVIDHGFRSLTGLILPININSENINIIEKIPFSNSMIKNYIIKNRPFKEKDLFIKNIKVYNFDEKIMNYITFD